MTDILMGWTPPFLEREPHDPVAGTRGTTPVDSSLLGSVASALTHHAHCPVLVVPAPSSGSARGESG